MGRRIYHVVHGKLPPWALRILPESHRVPERISQIPYDSLVEDIDPQQLQDGDAPRRRVPKKGLDPIEKLYKFGCDDATAYRLLNKFSRFEQRNIAEQYPLEVLFNECDAAMKGHKHDLEEKKNEQHMWSEQRKTDLVNLEDRQKVLNEVAGSFQKLHPEGLEQLPERTPLPALAVSGMPTLALQH